MKIAILGAGKVGLTIALMLKKSKFCSDLSLAGIEPRPESKALGTVDFVKLDITDQSALRKFIAGRNAVVSAAPFFLNRAIAEACAHEAVSYFDLTEDVETTTLIRTLAEKAPVTFMPQCGLAPDATNIIGFGLVLLALKKFFNTPLFPALTGTRCEGVFDATL
jgi:saccharopine dehydrogenase-like NADP-dependent oxidoreductase